MSKTNVISRANLIRVIKILNKETDLLKKIGEACVVVVGKGTKAVELTEHYKRIMLKLDEKKLIDETPEEAIDFWEDNLEHLVEKTEKLDSTIDPPAEKEEPKKKTPAEKKAPEEKEAVDGTPFAALKVKIKGRTDDKLTYYIDKLLLEGGNINKIFEKTSLQAVTLDVKFGTTNVGEIRALIKHRESIGWKFQIDGEKVKLVNYSKPVK